MRAVVLLIGSLLFVGCAATPPSPRLIVLEQGKVAALDERLVAVHSEQHPEWQWLVGDRELVLDPGLHSTNFARWDEHAGVVLERLDGVALGPEVFRVDSQQSFMWHSYISRRAFTVYAPKVSSGMSLSEFDWGHGQIHIAARGEGDRVERVCLIQFGSGEMPHVRLEFEAQSGRPFGSNSLLTYCYNTVETEVVRPCTLVRVRLFERGGPDWDVVEQTLQNQISEWPGRGNLTVSEQIGVWVTLDHKLKLQDS